MTNIAERQKSRVVDWPALRADYESTLISARALAQKHGATAASISYHVKRHAWKRPDEFAQHGNILPATSIKPDGKQLTEVPIAEDIVALTALRDRIVGEHKVDISRDRAYLNALELAILEKKSAPLQKLNALQTIVKIRGQLIELERQAHSIAAGGDKNPAATNIQVNVNVTPQDAYRNMLEGK